MTWISACFLRPGMMNSIQFEIVVEAEKDTNLWIVPADAYKEVMEESAAVANIPTRLWRPVFLIDVADRADYVEKHG